MTSLNVIDERREYFLHETFLGFEFVCGDYRQGHLIVLTVRFDPSTLSGARRLVLKGILDASGGGVFVQSSCGENP
jgi:hypothetical protein